MIAAASRGGPRHMAAAARGTVRLVPFEPGVFAVSLSAPAPSGASGAGLRLPAVQICLPASPHPATPDPIKITDAAGRSASWLAAGEGVLLVTVRQSGTLLVTTYLATDGAAPPLEIRRLDAAGGVAPHSAAASSGERQVVPSAGEAGGPQSPQQVHLDLTAHIRGRGDVSFADAAGVTRLGAGAWIEALTIKPHDPAAAATIECKGLLANGAETPWIGCGAVCGVTGQGLPLIGFAVRQRAATAQPLFDCEYGGQFQSGTRVGPMRNGAPCRSPLNGDPLEGMQLRLLRRLPPAPGR